MKIVFILLFLAIFGITATVQADVLFITNKNVDEKNITAKDIKQIFLGKKKKWPDNSKIHFVILGEENLHGAFIKTYLKKTPKQFKAYWKNMVFSGKGRPPKNFKTTEELIEYVANTKGAIGYIDSSTTAVNVNTITVE